MKSNTYFVLAAFIVAAALWKGGVPAVPILGGVALTGVWRILKSQRAAAR
jgi:hypothetical protein